MDDDVFIDLAPLFFLDSRNWIWSNRSSLLSHSNFLSSLLAMFFYPASLCRVSPQLKLLTRTSLQNVQSLTEEGKKTGKMYWFFFLEAVDWTWIIAPSCPNSRYVRYCISPWKTRSVVSLSPEWVWKMSVSKVSDSNVTGEWEEERNDRFTHPLSLSLSLSFLIFIIRQVYRQEGVDRAWK